MKKKYLIVGNWKMNMGVGEASALLHRISERIRIHRDVETVLAPSMLALQPLSVQLDRRKFRLASQNAHHIDAGPYTGEVSFTMLRDLVHYGLVGHSERRYKFGEDLPTIREKVAAAIRNEISPILCVGETKQERLDKETTQVLHDHVSTALSNVTSAHIEEVVIAYEPVWALSNGTDFSHHKSATPEDISKAIKTIRNNVKHMFGAKAAERIRVLYGGSVNASTASGILRTEGVDGLLIGGASLNYDEFSSIVNTAYKLTREEADNG